MNPETYEFKFRKTASYDEEYVDFYRDQMKITKSFFYNTKMTSVFITAMALGYKKDIRRPIKKAVPNIPTDRFSKEDKWSMISLYLKTHPNAGIEALWEPDQILKNAEEYANGGIQFLKMLYDDSDEPLEALEEEFRKYLL